MGLPVLACERRAKISGLQLLFNVSHTHRNVIAYADHVFFQVVDAVYEHWYLLKPVLFLPSQQTIGESKSGMNPSGIGKGLRKDSDFLRSEFEAG